MSAIAVESVERRAQAAGAALIRYGLVVVVAWIGAMKFTADEAKGIVVLVEHSPFMSWVYGLWSVQAFSNLLGVVEIGIAALVAAGRMTPRLSAVGSAAAIAMFTTTLSFLFTTPGWDAKLGGFPALSGAGQFLVKDVVLLGAAVWTLGDALACERARRSRPNPLATRAE